MITGDHNNEYRSNDEHDYDDEDASGYGSEELNRDYEEIILEEEEEAASAPMDEDEVPVPVLNRQRPRAQAAAAMAEDPQVPPTVRRADAQPRGRRPRGLRGGSRLDREREDDKMIGNFFAHQAAAGGDSLGERALTGLLAQIEEASVITDFTPEGYKPNLRVSTPAALTKQVLAQQSNQLKRKRSIDADWDLLRKTCTKILHASVDKAEEKAHLRAGVVHLNRENSREADRQQRDLERARRKVVPPMNLRPVS